MKRPLTKFEKIAVWVNNRIGTIEFAILCFILVTIPIVEPRTQTVIFYISSGYLQLVLLPLIIMGGNIQSRQMEEMEKSHYDHIKNLEKKILDAINETKSKGA